MEKFLVVPFAWMNFAVSNFRYPTGNKCLGEKIRNSEEPRDHWHTYPVLEYKQTGEFVIEK